MDAQGNDALDGLWHVGLGPPRTFFADNARFFRVQRVLLLLAEAKVT